MEYEELILYFIEHLRLALNALQVLYIKNDNICYFVTIHAEFPSDI